MFCTSPACGAFHMCVYFVADKYRQVFPMIKNCYYFRPQQWNAFPGGEDAVMLIKMQLEKLHNCRFGFGGTRSVNQSTYALNSTECTDLNHMYCILIYLLYLLHTRQSVGVHYIYLMRNGQNVYFRSLMLNLTRAEW